MISFCSMFDRRNIDSGVGSFKKLGGTGFEGHFWNEKGTKIFSRKCWRRGKGGGREGKINAIINQRPLRPTHGCKSSLQLFLHETSTVQILQLDVAPARFPVLKGPVGRQRVRAKQAGHFSLFNCPTLK